MDRGVFLDLAYNNNFVRTIADKVYTYYKINYIGYTLTFRKNKYRKGRRMYKLDDELAQMLGYRDVAHMKEWKPKIRFKREYLSPQSLAKHYGGYKYFG